MNKKMRFIQNKIDVLYDEVKELKEKKEIDKALAKIEEISNLEKEYELEEKLYNMEKEDAKEIAEDEKNVISNKVEKKEEDGTTRFLNAIRNYSRSGRIEDLATGLREGSQEDGGLIVPVDVLTKINQKIREFSSLEQYVNVLNVKTLSGSRVWEKDAVNTPFGKVVEGGKFTDTNNPQFELIQYNVEKFGGILKLTYELLQDTDQNLTAYVTEWLAKKYVATVNNEIIALLNATYTTTTALTSYDDVKTILNVSLDPAIRDMAVVITNQDGYNWLDTLKDGEGRYILKDSITDPRVRMIEGKIPVVVVTNTVLANSGKKVPFYIGAMKEAVTMFKREGFSLMSSDTAGALWEEDLIGMKVRFRMQVKSIDKDAVVKAEFTKKQGCFKYPYILEVK